MSPSDSSISAITASGSEPSRNAAVVTWWPSSASRPAHRCWVTWLPDATPGRTGPRTVSRTARTWPVKRSAGRCQRAQVRKPAMTSRRSRGEVVAERRTDVAGPRRPGTAPQDLAGSEPRLGVVPVGVGLEVRERRERRGRPLPDVADELAVAPGTVAGGVGRDRGRSTRPGPPAPPRSTPGPARPMGTTSACGRRRRSSPRTPTRLRWGGVVRPTGTTPRPSHHDTCTMGWSAVWAMGCQASNTRRSQQPPSPRRQYAGLSAPVSASQARPSGDHSAGVA